MIQTGQVIKPVAQQTSLRILGLLPHLDGHGLLYEAGLKLGE